jgi:hypothetical protein
MGGLFVPQLVDSLKSTGPQCVRRRAKRAQPVNHNDAGCVLRQSSDQVLPKGLQQLRQHIVVQTKQIFGLLTGADR